MFIVFHRSILRAHSSIFIISRMAIMYNSLFDIKQTIYNCNDGSVPNLRMDEWHVFHIHGVLITLH